jgi:hypothetical protein
MGLKHCVYRKGSTQLQSVAKRDQAPKRDSASCSLGIYAVKRGVHARLSEKIFGDDIFKRTARGAILKKVT